MSAPAAVRTRRGSHISTFGILIGGVLVIPFVLSALFNSYGALTYESAIRMGFATAAGQTIAILSAIGVIALAVARRRTVDHAAFLIQVVVLTFIALAITVNAFGVMSSAGELLLTRLDLVAETAKLNG